MYHDALWTWRNVFCELWSIVDFQEAVAAQQEIGTDLEQVEVLQKKFDDFKGDLKANEVRLQEMNQIATALTSVGQTETAVRIRQQIEDLNAR